MDIANHMGFGTTPHMSRAAGFAVALAGLTDNPVYGPCAQRGVPVQARTSGWGGPLPAGVTYQWHTLDGGPIQGAVADTFVPDAPLAPETVIFCVVAAPGRGSRATEQVVFRDAAPELGSALFDEVFDLDTGPQVVAAAAGFSGLNLRYSVTGAGAGIDPVTGDVSVPTDIERDGDIIVVTATNSGGAASAAFQVTVEDVAVEGALPFGALTPAGAGGVPVNAETITAGDPAGHWRIAGGLLVPTAAGAGALDGLYPLEFDTGETLDVLIERDKASARPEEIAAVFADLPVTARGLLVQDGDARALGRIRLVPKVFEREMVLEPANWIEDADPRASWRPVTLGGLTIGGDLATGNVANRMENLTVQGFVFQMETGPGETEGNNGIVRVERPSRHVTIRQNEIWSRDTREIIEADDYRDNINTSRQMRGIATKVAGNDPAKNEHIRIEENHIHSVSRGVVMTTTDAYQGVRSRLCGNYIEHCYTNFFTAGFFDGLDIFDNRCMGVYAALRDTLGAVPATSPHSAAGGSFDTYNSRQTQNVSVMGNLLHVGWLRTKICEELGLPKPSIGATGMKFNDPRFGDSYYNLVVAFNVVVSHGPSLAIDGANADSHNLVFNNSLIYESYANDSSPPSFSFGGAAKIRLFNNISTGYYINSEDGTANVSGQKTLDTLEGYGNLKLTQGDTAFGENTYFVGHPAKGVVALTIDEALEAYVPKPGSGAMAAIQKKGALGTGLYLENGVHRVIWDRPEPVSGVSDVAPLTLWGGTSYIQRNAQLTGSADFFYKSFLFAWEGEIDAGGYTTEMFLMSYPSSQFFIKRFAYGGLEIFAKHNSTGTFVHAISSLRLNPADGLTRLAISYDMPSGRLQIAKNGVLDGHITYRTLASAERMHVGGYPFRLHADHNGGNRFVGRFGRAYYNPMRTFFDLESDAGLSALFAADGGFRDWGSNGELVTGSVPAVYLRGTAASMANRGNGGAFTLIGGALTD